MAPKTSGKKKASKRRSDTKPCALLTSVTISAGYSESVDGPTHRTYKASIMQTLTLDPEHPDFDEVSAKWKDPEVVNSVRRFLSEMLKESIHEEMIEDGARTPEDDEDDEDEDDLDDEDDEEEEDDEDDLDDEDEDEDEDEDDEDEDDDLDDEDDEDDEYEDDDEDDDDEDDR